MIGSRNSQSLIKQFRATIPRGLFSTSAVGSALHSDVINHASCDGGMILDKWLDVETSEGVYDWAHIDSEVARFKAAGKLARIAVHVGGDDTPSWVMTNYPTIKEIIWYDKTTGLPQDIPAFWDTTYIGVRKNFFEALGDRYKREPTVFAMSASYVNPNTGDWTFALADDDDDAQYDSYIAAGFTEAVFLAGHKQTLDDGMAAFKNKIVISAVGTIPAPELVSDQYAAVYSALDYAFATYGNRLVIAKGSLNTNTPDESVVSVNHPWSTMSAYMPQCAGQFVWAITSDPAFQMNGQNSYDPYPSAEAQTIFAGAFTTGKTYDLRWVEAWSIDFRQGATLDDELAAGRALFLYDGVS